MLWARGLNTSAPKVHQCCSDVFLQTRTGGSQETFLSCPSLGIPQRRQAKGCDRLAPLSSPDSAQAAAHRGTQDFVRLLSIPLGWRFDRALPFILKPNLNLSGGNVEIRRQFLARLDSGELVFLEDLLQNLQSLCGDIPASGLALSFLRRAAASWATIGCTLVIRGLNLDCVHECSGESFVSFESIKEHGQGFSSSWGVLSLVGLFVCVARRCRIYSDSV